MKDDKSLEDEYSILNIYKNHSETDLDWKTYNKNTEPSLSKIKEKSKTSGKNITLLKNNNSVIELKNTISKIQKETENKLLESENISYKRYKHSKSLEKEQNLEELTKENTEVSDKHKSTVNVFQKQDQESFHIEKIDLSDLKSESFNYKSLSADNCKSNRENLQNDSVRNEKGNQKNIDPKIQNILKERLSNVLTPRANMKTGAGLFQLDSTANLNANENQILLKNEEEQKQTDLNETNVANIYKNSCIGKNINLTNNNNSSLINQEAINKVKRKLDEEINKKSKYEKINIPKSGNQEDDNILKELKSKIANELILKREIINLETTIRLQKVEIDMLRSRELPNNNSGYFINECRNAIDLIRKELKIQEDEFKSELKIEKSRNLHLSKEVDSLKLIINNLLEKTNK